MDIELDAERNDSKNKEESNHRSYCAKSDNLSNDTPSKFNVEHENKCQKDGQIQLNSSQMETCGKTGRIEEIKYENKHVEPQSFQSNKTTTIDLRHHSSSSSSSSEDVFQTRYSIFDKNDYKATGNMIDYALNLIENNSDEECTSENIPKIKKSPIIIEEQAYTENKDPIKQFSANNKMLSQIKEETETSVLKETKRKTELRDCFIVEHENKCQKDGQIQLNSSQMETCGKTGRIEEIKYENKHIEPQSFQSNKTTTIDLRHHSSSSSSSSEDVFQTRYSIFDKNDYKATGNMIDYALNLIENISDEEHTSENIPQMKKSPIITEEQAYTENKDPIKQLSTNNKMLSQIEEETETSLLKEIKRKTELRDASIEDKHSLNTNIKSNFAQISEDSLSADLNFSDSISKRNSYKKYVKEMVVDVTVTPKQSLGNKNIEKPTVMDENIIIEEFFNGTFDISRYQLVSSKTTEYSNQYENNKLKSVMLTKEGKSNHKRKRNELTTTNKRVKHETILESKNKKNTLKPGEGSKEHNKKSSKKELNENLNSYQMLNAFSNKIQPQQKKTKENSFNINFLGLTDGARENKHMELKNCQMEYEDNNKHETEEHSVQNKYSRRKVRSSSQAASKKIKEIKKIENLLDHDEIVNDNETETDINYGLFNTYKDHSHKETLRNLKRNSNIFKPKTTSTNRSKEKHENRKSKISMQHENRLDEITLSDEETEIPIYDDLLNTHKEYNYKETLYELRGNSNTFKPKTTGTNRKNENKKSKSSMQRENGFTAIKERKDIEQHSKINKINFKHTDGKQISRPIIHLRKYPYLSKIPVKQNTSTDNNKNKAANLNSFYTYVANADHNLPKDHPTFEKRSKIDIDSKNSDLIHNSSAFFMGENSQTEDTNNLTVFKEYTKESQPKTWEMFENELVEDLKNEQLSDNICKTVVLKKHENVMKKEVAKDRNLFTVSNTSMSHTISKSKTGNNYNLKYQIRNTTKSQFVGSKTDPTYNFKTASMVQQMNRKDSNFKSSAIVNKALKAMEKCVAKFTAPELKPCNAGHMVSNHPLENLFDNSDTPQEAQFPSQMTFMAYDNKKCYSNKIVSCTKKSKSCDFALKDNPSKAVSNFSGAQSNKKDSQRALSKEYPYKSNKSTTEYLRSHTNYKTPAFVPKEEDKNNPWENLIEKMDLQEEEYQDLNEETGNNNCKMKDKNTESLKIMKSFTQNSSNLERKEALVIQTECEVKKTKLPEETLVDQHIPADKEESVLKGEEINNPWENLIEKMDLQEEGYQDLNKETGFSNYEMKDKNTSVITKTYPQNPNNLERNETLLMQTECEETLFDDRHIPADVKSDTVKSKIRKPETQNISFVENLNLSSMSNQSKTEKMKNAQRNNDFCGKLELQKINNRNKIPEEGLLDTASKNKMKSPSFKFKLNKCRDLKQKKYTGSSSSKEDSPQSKKAKVHEKKGSKCNTSVTNKSREQYKDYLKKIFDSQNSAVDEDDETKSVEENTISNNNSLEELLDKSPESLNKTKDSLIARQEDDIFSITSSSDESSD